MGRRRDRVDALVGLAVLTLLLVELASARTYTRALVHPAFATGVAALLGALAALWLRTPRWVASLTPGPGRWLGLLVLAFGGGAVALRAVDATPVPPLLALGLSACGGLALVAYGSLRRHVHTVVAGAAVTGLALRALELSVVPIDPRRGDMLPLVLLSLRSLASGEAPYRTYFMPWAVPLTYLPLDWLAYAPASLAGLDIRWTNAVADLSILGAIFFVARERTDKAPRDAAATLWAAWFVSHSVLTFDADVAAAPQWAALAWAAALAIEAHRFAPIVFGAALATTPLGAPLLPSVLLAWRGSRLRALAIVAAATAVLVGPWLLAAPRGFVDGVVLWFNDLDRFPRAKWMQSRAWCADPGLACAFWSLGLERLLKPLQLALVGALAWRFSRRGPARRPALGAELVGIYLVFVLTNPVVWAYLWEPALVLALVALAGARVGPSRR